jgi:hypothetical protein
MQDPKSFEQHCWEVAFLLFGACMCALWFIALPITLFIACLMFIF